MPTYLAPAHELSIKHTFRCGQCFRFRENADGSYTFIAFSRVCRIYESDGSVYISDEDAALWRRYFDLDRDYGAIFRTFPRDDFTRAALRHGAGLRVLRQEPWEALCAFIISQCNNIPRIMRIMDVFCTLFGEPIVSGSETFYAFPTSEKIAGLPLEALAPLRAGYRAKYLLGAARAVSSGALDFQALAHLSTEEAREKVMMLDGVGRKVADCFLLFGLARDDAFPVDTWMRKARAYYPGGFDAAAFGQNAGIAQQYIFYYARAVL